MNLKMKQWKICVTAIVCLAFAGLTNAAVYEYNGGGSDSSDWTDPANWTVTGSTDGWTYPNEEFGNEYTNQDSDEININGAFSVSTFNNSGGAGWVSIDGARDGSNTAVLTLDGGASLAVPGGMWASDAAGTKSYLKILGNSTLDVTGVLKVADDPGSISTLDVVNGNLNTSGHLVIANSAGSNGTLNVSGNSLINIGGTFYMNDAGGSGSTSSVVMDGGTVNVNGNSYFNDDAGAGSMATFVLNGGDWNGGNNIDISWNLDATSHLTVNGGNMIAQGAIRMGVGGGGNTGEGRIFMNGGVLQAEDLLFNMADSKIVFSDGEFRINSAAMDEAAMSALIGTKIEVTGGFEITTDGAYTVLLKADLIPVLVLEVDRTTGAMTIKNQSGGSKTINGLSLTSAAGALDSDDWKSIAENYDADNDTSVDPDDNWTLLSTTFTELAEGEINLGGGNGATIINGQAIDLGNGPWIQYYNEEVFFEYLLADGSVASGLVKFVGNGDVAFDFGDLNFDGAVDANDWADFVAGFANALTGDSLALDYRNSDLNGDGLRNGADFLLFKNAFDAANGEGAFDVMVSDVPEPATMALFAVGGLGMIRRRRSSKKTTKTLRSNKTMKQTSGLMMLVAAVLMVTAGSASAAITDDMVGLWKFDNTYTDSSGQNNNGTAVGSENYVAGQIGNSVDFDGTSANYMTLDHTTLTDLDFGSTDNGTDVDLTISIWFNQNTNTSDPAVFSNKNWDNGGLTGLNFSPKGTSIFDLNTKGDTGARSDLDGGGNSASTGVNQWSHVLVTIDRSGLTTMFINGVQTGTTASSQGSFNGDLPWVVGQDGTGTYGVDFTGQVDDLAIWRRALKPLEAQAIYDGGLNGQSVDEVTDPIFAMLEVNTTTGKLKLIGGDELTSNINSYEITSEAGSLDGASWATSNLDSQNVDPVDDGADPGETWGTLNGDANQLFEAFLLGGSSAASGNTLTLGKGFAVGGAEDLAISITTVDGQTFALNVAYVQGGVILGDVNGDGLVNGFDVDPFVDVLLNGPYQAEADVNEDGAVNGFDVDPFVALVLGGGSAPQGTEVPEPTTLALLGLGGLAALRRRQH